MTLIAPYSAATPWTLGGVSPRITAAPSMIASTMLWYPVQRQRLPSRYSRTSRSDGLGLFLTRSRALMIIPGVQNPHCSAWLLRNASCIGCRVSPSATASIVNTERPSACIANSVHDLTASPSTCTTQAPHWLVSQPTCVPVRPSCSRNSCTKRVRPSTVAETGLPFTVRLTVFCIDTSLHRSQLPSRDGKTRPKFYSGPAWGQGVRGGSLTGDPTPGKEIENPADDCCQPGNPQDWRQSDVVGLCRLGARPAAVCLRLDGSHRRCRATVRRQFVTDRPLRRGFDVGCPRCCRLLRRDRGDEAREELVCHSARDRVDKARADLRKLDADMRLEGIAQNGLGALLVEIDLGAALGKPGSATAALTADRVALRRVEIGQDNLAAEGRLHRPDRGEHPGGELGVRHLLDRLATGNSLFEDLRIVEPLPYALAGSGDAMFARHLHRHYPFLRVASVALANGDCNRMGTVRNNLAFAAVLRVAG